MFESARLKLTLFYLAIIVLLSLTLSFGTRWLAQREFEHSNVTQRGQIRGLFMRNYGPGPGQAGPSLQDIQDVQKMQEAQVRHKLNEYVVFINLGALVIGGALSYWFATRTLRPIEEAHEAEKRFAADASHELRTPLTTMRAENEVFLRQKDFTKPEARELIESNLEEIQRLEQLSTNLLLLTNYEGAKLELTEVSVIDLVTTVRDNATKNQPGLSKRLKIILQEATVKVHPDSAAQLLGIILDNAVKYTPKIGDIELNGTLTDGHYVLQIDDHGTGIAEEDLPHIFDRLYRGDKARSRVAGYGLGLSLAQEIAKANHAQLTAENNPSGGARFSFTVPTVNRTSS